MVHRQADDEQWRISDEQWNDISPLLPPEPPRKKGGRPRMPARRMMEAIFYVVETGCKWKSLPRQFGAPSTVYGHFQFWRDLGVFQQLADAHLLPRAWQAALSRQRRRPSGRFPGAAEDPDVGQRSHGMASNVRMSSAWGRDASTRSWDANETPRLQQATR
jgi:transposase